MDKGRTCEKEKEKKEKEKKKTTQEEPKQKAAQAIARDCKIDKYFIK